ncbi:hypothetical protein IQ07DRAFT_589300, partial [Pyrenochaeta sp. DS3sAY3a]
MYTIAGRQVGSHVLAMATLGATFAGAYLAMGGKKVEEKTTPPINAKSKEEESFVKYGLPYPSPRAALSISDPV